MKIVLFLFKSLSQVTLQLSNINKLLLIPKLTFDTVNKSSIDILYFWHCPLIKSVCGRKWFVINELRDDVKMYYVFSILMFKTIYIWYKHPFFWIANIPYYDFIRIIQETIRISLQKYSTRFLFEIFRLMILIWNQLLFELNWNLFISLFMITDAV